MNLSLSSCLLGMSGGTDSSMAAVLLQEQGYRVVGVTFRFWDSEGMEQHIRDAQVLAARLGIEHFVYDAVETFRKEIVEYFVSEYLAGRTPVPCVKCNNQLKWKLLAELAPNYSCATFSTGHYCNKTELNGYHYITKGLDPDKDQSFFLWGLSQEIIKNMLLPLGNYTKQQVRQMAAEKGFAKIADKKDSLGVCFCADDYRAFLREHAPDFQFRKGVFVDEAGVVLGTHEGYPFYTVGQRRGLGIQLNRAVFVKEIRPAENEVVLAPLKSLYKTEFCLKDWNLINEADFSQDYDIITKIRYRKQATLSRVVKQADGLLKVELSEPLESIAPGQAAAFYKEDRVVGGGVIV